MAVTVATFSHIGALVKIRLIDEGPTDFHLLRHDLPPEE